MTRCGELSRARLNSDRNVRSRADARTPSTRSNRRNVVVARLDRVPRVGATTRARRRDKKRRGESKRMRDDDDARDGARARDALARHGESFMAMFDDDDGDARRRRGTRGATKRDAAAAKKKTKKRARDDDDATTTRDARETAAVARESGAANASGADDGKTMVFDGRRTVSAARARDASAASASASGRLIDTKKARKAFMSADAGKVLNDDVVKAARERAKDAEDGGEARFGKFSALREEVQAFGARGLAKWDRQALETKRLVELGMKPKKGPRIPPTIGVGLAKANEKRAETARQEAFAAGYKLEKKAAKKSSDGARDRGLAWGSSTFSTSNGVMKVNKRDMVNHDKLVDTKAMLRGEGRRPQMKSSGKKTKKRGKAVKAGRKSKR